MTGDSLWCAEEQQMYRVGRARVGWIDSVESDTGDAGPEPCLDCIAIAHLVPRYYHDR